jgi:hypothetical protein
MTDRLTGIEERLKEGTAYRPAPHRPVVNTAGDRHGVVDSSGCVVDMDSPAAARFYAAAPTDMAALLGAVNAVHALHKPERRWMPYDEAGYSFATEKEAYEALADADANQVVLGGIAANGLPYFEVCAHCKTVEEGACEGECTRELGYLTSLWPCPTVTAINAALEGK